MAQFSVNTDRFDPYKNFKFRVRWEGRDVLGVSRVSALSVTNTPVEHMQGTDVGLPRKSPGDWASENVTLERGITYDMEFHNWATMLYNMEGAGGISLANFRKDITIQLLNLQGTVVKAYNLYSCWVAEYTFLPELDANQSAIAIETIGLAHEGIEMDEAVTEQEEF